MRFGDAGDSHNRDREKGRYRKDDVAVKLNLLAGLLGKGVLKVGLHNIADDQQEDGNAADECPDSDRETEGFPPSEFRVLCSYESL